MNRISLSMILSIIFFYAYSQISTTVYSGVVMDSESKEPMPYVTVFLKSGSIGNVSNQEGFFLIKIPASHMDDTLVFSHLGYHSRSIPLNDLKAHESHKIYLNVQYLELEEIEVLAKQITADDVMDSVRSNRRKNFPINPFRLEGYYKHKLKVNHEEVAFIEVALELVDKDFQPYNYKNGVAQEEIILKGIRTNIAYTDEYQSALQNFPSNDFLNNMLIINRARRGFKGMQYQIDTVLNYNKSSTYVILATLEDLDPKESFWKIKIFVNADDYAIIRVESFMDVQGKNIEVFDQKLNDVLTLRPLSLTRIFEFRKRGDRYYPFYYKVSGRQVLDDLDSKVCKLYEYENELVLFKQLQTEIDRKRKRSKASLIDEQFEGMKYDAAFWEEFNYVPLTAEELETSFIDFR